MSEFEPEMSHDDAVAALTAAAQADAGEQAPAPVESPVAQGALNEAVPETPAAVPDPRVTPAADPSAPVASGPVAAEEGTAEESFFNPDSLPPELLPAWKQLQGAFTQKTQGLAERSRQLEQYGDAETLSDAVELYNRITDPDNWPQLAQELSDAMQEAGMSPAEANKLAVEELQIQSQQGDPLDGLDLSDPEIAPLAQALRAQQARQDALDAQLQEFQLTQQQAAEYEEAEREQHAHALGIREQLVAIAQARPDYDSSDMEDIVKLAPFFNDDFFAAQAAYEGMAARRLSRYFEGKQKSLTPSVQPPGTPGASVVVEDDSEKTLQEVGREVEEYMRSLQAAGELDL